MCSEIWVPAENREIGNVGGLKAICPWVFTVEGVSESDLTDNDCLCGVNIPATLVHGGYKVWLEPENASLGIFSCEKVPTPSQPSQERT